MAPEILTSLLHFIIVKILQEPLRLHQCRVYRAADRQVLQAERRPTVVKYLVLRRLKKRKKDYQIEFCEKS